MLQNAEDEPTTLAPAPAPAPALPANVKALVSIRGLAYCLLKPADPVADPSVINFLTHVENHVLTMIIRRKQTPPGSTYTDMRFRIQPGDQITIEVQNSTPPVNYFATIEGNPLEEMVNLNTLHIGKTNTRVIDPIARPTHPPTVINIKHAEYYTQEIHKTLFKFVERQRAMSLPPAHIGYQLGGYIKAATPASKLIISSRGNSIPGRNLELDGKVGDRIYTYEIVLNNHCPKAHEEECKAHVAQSGRKGSDFGFYYDVLNETNNPWRRFDLVPHKVDDDGTVQEGGTEEVAACNPVILDPPEPYV